MSTAETKTTAKKPTKTSKRAAHAKHLKLLRRMIRNKLLSLKPRLGDRYEQDKWRYVAKWLNHNKTGMLGRTKPWEPRNVARTLSQNGKLHKIEKASKDKSIGVSKATVTVKLDDVKWYQAILPERKFSGQYRDGVVVEGSLVQDGMGVVTVQLQYRAVNLDAALDAAQSVVSTVLCRR